MQHCSEVVFWESSDNIRLIATSPDQRVKGFSVDKNGSFSWFSGQLPRSSKYPLSLWLSVYTSDLFSELSAGWKSIRYFCQRIYTSVVIVATSIFFQIRCQWFCSNRLKTRIGCWIDRKCALEVWWGHNPFTYPAFLQTQWWMDFLKYPPVDSCTF